MYIAVSLFLFTYLLNRVISTLKKSSTAKSKSQTQNPKDTPAKTTDAYLQRLIEERKQIMDSIEQYNNPSTFAKYSKMQRTLNKLEAEIEQQNAKNQKLQKNNNRQSSEGVQRESSRVMPYLEIVCWLGLTILSCKMTVLEIPEGMRSGPLWLVSNSAGRVSGWTVVFLSKMILSI